MAARIPLISIKNLNPSKVTTNIEEIQLIYLDETLEPIMLSPEVSRDPKLIKELNAAAQFFSSPKKCINFMDQVKNEQIFLVVSAPLAEQTLLNVHHLTQLSAAFIFCHDRTMYSNLLTKYHKVIDIFEDQNALLDSIRESIYLVELEMFSINTFHSKDQTSFHELSKENAPFLCDQLLLKVLRDMPHGDEEKKELVDKCGTFYRNDPVVMQKIEEFKKYYSANQALKWYTKDSFLYKILNKAFRTDDIDWIYSLRFFIIDLCSQLDVEKVKIKNSGVVTLYRGQRLPRSQLTTLQKMVGQLIAMKGFLSTSRNKNVALRFATGTVIATRTKQDHSPVLFEIRADPSGSIVFADIQAHSEFRDEKEVLFGPNTTFIVDSVNEDQINNVTTVQMSASDKGEDLFQSYMAAQADEREKYKPLIYFGRILFNQLHNMHQAKLYFKRILNGSLVKSSFVYDDDIVQIYIQLGDIDSKQGNCKEAKQYYQKAMEMYYKPSTQHNSSDYPYFLTDLWIKIGQVCLNQGKLNQQSEGTICPHHLTVINRFSD